jgi:hypothetical protein
MFVLSAEFYPVNLFKLCVDVIHKHTHSYKSGFVKGPAASAVD